MQVCAEDSVANIGGGQQAVEQLKIVTADVFGGSVGNQLF